MTATTLESRIQSTFVTWLWNTHPKTRGCFFSVTNSGAKISQKILKAFLLDLQANIFDYTYCSNKIELFLSAISKGNNVTGAIDKALGLVPGVSDCIFIWKNKIYCVEFKTEIGKQSPRQQWWQDLIEKQGATYIILRSFDQAKEWVEEVIKNNAVLPHVSASSHIDFAVYLTGHDEKTIRQMYNDWRQ